MKIKLLAKDFLIYGFSNILIKLISLVSLPIISRIFSVSDYGVIETVSSVVALFPTFIGLGYDVALLKEMVLEKDEGKSKTISTSIFIFLLSWGGIIVVFLILFAEPFSVWVLKSAEYAKTWRIACITIYVDVFFAFSLQLLRVQFKAKTYTLFNALFGIGQHLAVIVAVALFRGGINGYFYARLINSLLWTSVSVFYSRAYLTGRIEKECVIRVVSFGIPVMISSLAYWVFNLSDRLVLTSMASLEQTGYYSMALRVICLLPVIISVFSQAWTPRAFELYKDSPEDYKTLIESVHPYFAAVLSVIALGNIAGSRIILLVFTTSKYLPCLPVVVPLALAFIFEGLSKVTSVGIYVNNKTKDIAIAAWSSAILNLAINLLFMKKYGAVVGGISTLVSYVFVYLYYHIKSCRYLDLPFKLAKPILVVVLAGLTGLLFSCFSLRNAILDCAAKLVLVAGYTVLLLITRILNVNELRRWYERTKNERIPRDA